MKISIKARFSDAILFEGEFESTKHALVEAVKNRAYLEGAYLEGADLKGADLKGAYLKGAYLEGADLKGADLKGAYLEGADLKGADLKGAYLEGAIFTSAKEDFFELLSHAVPEIPLLKETIIAGKIDGSVYEGSCACLCGTIEKGGRFDGACDMRDASRPIERFALGIRPGRTPENDDRCKLLVEWIEEFENNLNQPKAATA